MLIIDDNNFDLELRRKLFYKRKKRRKRLIRLFFASPFIFLIISTIIIAMYNTRKTTATFNLAFPKAVQEETYTVCIDPGHGDWDYGAIGINNSLEKDIVLSVALKLGELLESDGNFKVVYTRGSDKISWLATSNDSLKERIKISKISKADIFVSIHCNYSSDSREVNGIETWYNPNDENSLILSQYIQDELINLSYTTNRGVKSYVSGEELAVLELNDNTSSLVELGFLTNSADERYLTSNIGQSNVANSIYKAILEYKNNSK